MYKSLFRPLLFHLNPERVHELTLQVLRFLGSFPLVKRVVQTQFDAHSQVSVTTEAFGLKFANPVGLAAGYDKDGLGWRGLTTLGFGHIEIGTVTPRPQVGNPKPRIFRIPEEQAVINRMGFPGRGADFLESQLVPVSSRSSSVILGINIGKNKDTPNEAAARDYVYLLEKFTPYADYFAINISSPNTIGLRKLQAREYLEDLLSQLAATRLQSPTPRPILVKLAPDLTDTELDEALAAILNTGMDGVVATNTTISREKLKLTNGQETGGLSGAPLTAKSCALVAKIYQRTNGKLPIVGVGGIMNPDDAKAMLAAGAQLIQLYTGLIYAGPGLVKDIVESL
jgi:dihydroorotate dehydrogenase